MKLQDRERVDGTSVTIGRRVYYQDSQTEVSRCYAAEYRDIDGKQVCRNLGTRSRAEARRKAVEIQQELELRNRAQVLVTDRAVIDNFAYFLRVTKGETQ